MLFPQTLDIVNQTASDTPSASSGLPRLDGSFGAKNDLGYDLDKEAVNWWKF